MKQVDEKVQEAFKKIEDGVVKVFESENYKKYLKFLSSFYNYSPNNVILILNQYEDATLVGGMNFWKKLNRNIKKGEKGIQILAPVPHSFIKKDEETGEEKEINYVTFRTSYVFDVSQTDGEELPTLTHKLKGTSNEIQVLIERMNTIFTEEGIKFEFWNLKGETNGFYRPADNFICVKKGLDDLQILKTMIHEFAHYTLHKNELGSKDKNEAELEAESVAYTVLNFFNLDSSEYSFGYLAGWSKKDVKLLKNTLKNIQSNTKEIIERIVVEEGDVA